MNKRGHTVGAVIASTASIYLLHRGFINESIITSGIIIGSFLPDLDAEYSYFNSKLPLLKKIYNILPENSLTKHRGGLLHSWLTILPFIYYRNNPICLGLLIGILGHHILDMTTKQGLRWFYPFKIIIHLWRKGS